MVGLHGRDAGGGLQDGGIGDEGGGAKVGEHLRVSQDEPGNVQGDEILVGGEGGVGVVVLQGGEGEVDEAVEGVADVDLGAGQGGGPQDGAQELQVCDLVAGKLLGQLKG